MIAKNTIIPAWLSNYFSNRSIAVITLVVLSTLFHPSAVAQKLSPAEAANSARQATGGKVLKVKPTQKGNKDYRVKVLSPDGRVRHITVDGNNGKLKRHQKK